MLDAGSSRMFFLVDRRRRRRRLGVSLSVSVGRAARREAHAKPLPAPSACRAPLRRQRASSPKSRREQVEDSLKELEQRQKKAKIRRSRCASAQAGLNWSKRQFSLSAPSRWRHLRLRHAVRCRTCSSRARRRICGRLRPAALDAFVSQEAPRDRDFSTIFPMPSTSSSAASRPACRCSTA